MSRVRRLCVLLALALVPADALAQVGRPQVIPPANQDVSPPLRDLPVTRWGDYTSMAIDPADDCTFFTFTPASTQSASSLSISAGTAAVGSYSLTVAGTSGALTHSTPLTLVIQSTADFSLSASPSSPSIVQGNSRTSTITVAPQGGFAGPVALSISGLPSGVSGSFSPASTQTASTLTLNVGPSVAPGSYPLTVTGTSGSLSRTTPVTLVVTAQTQSVVIRPTPASRTFARGDTGAFALTIARTGFNGVVTLTATGVPSHASASFSPNPVATGTSTLTVSSQRSVKSGTYTITIKGTSGAVTATTTVTVVIQ